MDQYTLVARLQELERSATQKLQLSFCFLILIFQSRKADVELAVDVLRQITSHVIPTVCKEVDQ